MSRWFFGKASTARHKLRNNFSVSRPDRLSESYQRRETLAKTARSRRTVYLPGPLLEKLKLHKRRQAVERIKLGEAWASFDLVFCSVEGTPLSIPNITYRYFRPILDAAKLPRIRLYDLRHSCATLLLIAEENPKVVSERLGHSTIVLTLDTYSHVLPTLQQGATTRLEKLLYSGDSVQSSDTPVILSQTVN